MSQESVAKQLTPYTITLMLMPPGMAFDFTIDPTDEKRLVETLNVRFWKRRRLL